MEALIVGRLKAGVPVCGMETTKQKAGRNSKEWLKAGVPVCGMETRWEAHRLLWERKRLKAGVPVCGMETPVLICQNPPKKKAKGRGSRLRDWNSANTSGSASQTAAKGRGSRLRDGNQGKRKRRKSSRLSAKGRGSRLRDGNISFFAISPSLG